MINPNAIVSPEQAEQLRCYPLTSNYMLPKEEAMLRAASRDLDRDGIDYLWVGRTKRFVSIWRKKKSLAPPIPNLIRPQHHPYPNTPFVLY